MHITHIAIWVNDLEEMKAFYEEHFDAKAGEKYENTSKQFESYFLDFESGSRLELMKKAGIDQKFIIEGSQLGLAHFAMALGSKELVDQKTNQLRLKDVEIVDEPRVTGDGYYESVIKDPEGNVIELTI